jgi:hypothetical protein
MPVDRGAIDAQLRDIGEGDRWWEQREFRDLPHILQAEERIRGLVMGRVLGPRRPRLKPAGRWLMVVTDQRLICLRQERFARKQIEVAAGQLRRIDRSSRLRSYQITIQTPQWRYRLRVARVDAARFAAALQTLLPAFAAPAMDPDERASTWLEAIPGVSRLLLKPGTSREDEALREHLERVEAAVERLHGDVERLQHQVAFIEDLLQKRAEGALM